MVFLFRVLAKNDALLIVVKLPNRLQLLPLSEVWQVRLGQAAGVTAAGRLKAHKEMPRL